MTINRFRNTLLATAVLGLSLIFVGCTNEETEKEDTRNVEEVSKVTQQKETVVATEIAEEETTVATEFTEEETNSLFFTRTDDSDNNGWKPSPSKLLQATIVGRGKYASEEGIATFVVKNNETNSSTTFTLGTNEKYNQDTPKAFEWIDDERVYIIIGHAYGTVTNGGDLYEFNLTDNTLIPVFEDLESNKEIISINKETDGNFVYKKQIYDTELIEEGKITPSSK